MRRRDFMTLLAAAAAWPVAAEAQPGSPMPRVGVLFPGSKSDPNVDKRQATLVNALQALGWTDGQNIRIVDRRSENDIDLMQAFAKELVSLKPAAIFAVTTQVVAAIQRETRDIPIVFVAVTDPVASGFVAGASRRKHHGLFQFRAHSGRQVHRNPEGDHSRNDNGRSHVQS